MNSKTIKIGKRKFNVFQAPATNQKRLLSLVGAKIALNSAASGVEKIDTSLLLGALLTLSESDFDDIAEIVLYKTAESGSDQGLVTIDDFQDGITAYYQLVAEAIALNLNDFFTYLDSVNAKARKAAAPVQ